MLGNLRDTAIAHGQHEDIAIAKQLSIVGKLPLAMRLYGNPACFRRLTVQRIMQSTGEQSGEHPHPALKSRPIVHGIG